MILTHPLLRKKASELGPCLTRNEKLVLAALQAKSEGNHLNESCYRLLRQAYAEEYVRHGIEPDADSYQLVLLAPDLLKVAETFVTRCEQGGERLLAFYSLFKPLIQKIRGKL